MTQKIHPQSIEQAVESEVPRTDNKKFFSKSRIKIFTAFTLIALFVSAAITIYPHFFNNQDIRGWASTSGTTLSLFPATKSIKTGDEFPLAVNLNTSTDTISAVNLSISYDPEVIKITKFTPSSSLPVIISPLTSNSGTSKVVIGVNVDSPFMGSSTVGTFNVKVISAKKTEIKIATTTGVASLGKDSSSLVSSTGTILTYTPSPDSSPNASPSATPAPERTDYYLVPKSLPSATIGRNYRFTIKLVKPKKENPKIVITNLPPGISASTCTQSFLSTYVNCVISGVPTQIGTYKLNISTKLPDGSSLTYFLDQRVVKKK